MNDDESVLARQDPLSRAAGGRTQLLSPEAERALAEAKARREAEHADRTLHATEISGRGGLEPVRYGDWEIKGLASDF